MDMDKVRQAAEVAVMKISDHERDEVVERLKAAYTANQITLDEFGRRSTAVMKARTELALRRVTWDLRELPARQQEQAPSVTRNPGDLVSRAVHVHEVESARCEGIRAGKVSGAAYVLALGCWGGVIWSGADNASALYALLLIPAILLLFVGAWYGTLYGRH